MSRSEPHSRIPVATETRQERLEETAGWGGEFQQTQLTATNGLTPYVRYGFPKKSDYPRQSPKLKSIDEPIPEEANTVSPVYLLTEEQIGRHNDEYSTGWETGPEQSDNIAKKLQNECEEEGRVLYPVYLESDDNVSMHVQREAIGECITDSLNCDPADVTWYFSGGSSIHAHLPFFVTTEGDRKRLKETVRRFNENSDISIDLSNYSPKSQFRLPGVEHEDWKDRQKIPISWDSTETELNREMTQATLNGVSKPKTAEELISTTYESSTPQYAADGCGGVRQPRSKSHEYLGRVELENAVLTVGDTEPSIETPLIERKEEELPDDLPEDEEQEWESYNNYEFSPYAKAKSGDGHSVAVVRVLGSPFCREKIGCRGGGIAVPAYFYGAIGCDGIFAKFDVYAPLQLSKTDCEKREYHRGDVLILIGGGNGQSIIHEVDHEAAVAVADRLDSENGSRRKAKEFLSEKGYDIGSTGPGTQNGNTATQTNRSGEVTRAGRLQQQAETNRMQSLSRLEQRNVANRLLRIGGWNTAWNWFKDQYGPEFDREVTWRELKSVANSYPDLNHIDVPTRPSE